MPENVELVRQAFGTEGERRPWDLERVRRASGLWDPEIVYEEAAEWPGAGTYQGREAVLAKFAEYMELLGEGEAEIDELTDAGEGRVFAVWRYRGVAAGSGVPVDQRWGYVFTLRDGRLVRWQAVLDFDAARKELGLG